MPSGTARGAVVPAGSVEDEKDDAFGAGADLAREQGEGLLEQRLGDPRREVPEALAGSGRDEGRDVEPLEAVMPQGDRALAARRPERAAGSA